MLGGHSQHRIAKIFVTHSINEACIYRVKFFINGLRTSILVDDYIPVNPNNDQPAFCRTKMDKQLFWAILIEKAWAKVNGSYFNILSQSLAFLAIHLTGVPADSINHKNIKFFEGGCWTIDKTKLDKSWQRICAALGHTYTLISQAKHASEFDKNSGIIGEACYELLDTQTLTVDGKKERLVLLRNNQNNEEWSYVFSRDCPSWSNSMRQQMYGTLPPGHFYMELGDFLRYFERTCISMDSAKRSHY